MLMFHDRAYGQGDVGDSATADDMGEDDGLDDDGSGPEVEEMN